MGIEFFNAVFLAGCSCQIRFGTRPSEFVLSVAFTFGTGLRNDRLKQKPKPKREGQPPKTISTPQPRKLKNRFP